MSAPLRLTVCGAGAAGQAIAADSALKGLAVTLFEVPALAAKLDAARATGGIEVTADSETTAGKTGFASLAGATDDPAEAVSRRRRGDDHGAGHVPRRLHRRPGAAPARRPIVLYSTGYWASLRQSLRLGEPRRRDSRRVQHHAVHLPDARRRHPHRPLQAALRRHRVPRRAQRRGIRRGAARIYSQYEPAPTVLDTNIAAAGNPPIHVTLTIPIAGFYFDKYMGGKFYQDATLPGARLVDASTRSGSGFRRASAPSSSRRSSSSTSAATSTRGATSARRCAPRPTPTGSRPPTIWNK